MPPEITAAPSNTAGLLALIAAPPGAASSAGPLLPEPLSASLFAAFLAQSGTPVPKADVPKTNATLTPNTNPKQMLLDTKELLDKQALLKSKTMDTLPTLSFPPALKVKVKASELLLHQTPIQPAPTHHMPVEVMPAPAVLPATVLPPADQAVMVLPLLAVLVPAMPAPVPAFVAPAGITGPIQSAPAQAHSIDVRPVSTPGPITLNPALSVPAGLLPHEAFTAPPAALPQTALPQTMPAGLSQEPSLELRPLISAPAVSNARASGPMTPSATNARPLAGAKTDALPHVASPVPDVASPVPAVPSPQSLLLQDALPVVPQEPTAALLQPAALAPSAATAPAVVTAVQQSLPTAAVPVGQPKPVPAKNAGSLTATLKPNKQNADTSTRIPQEQTVTAKAGTPAAAPEPLLMPEKHAAEEEPSGTAESGPNSGMPALPMGLPASVVKTETKPLTAGERAEVVRQAADGIGAMPVPMKPGEAQQMSMQLHPKDWGSLQVSVTVAPGQEAGAAKTVTAHIVAETSQVKAALQSQNGALHQALRASGLHLEHLTVSVKTTDARIPEVKPAAQSASAGFSSGQGQSDKSGQSYGQPSAGTNGFGLSSGASGGAGGSQSNPQGRPPQAFMPAMTNAEPDDVPAASLPLRLAAGRIDTHA